MRKNLAAVSDLNVFFDICIWSYFYVLTELCVRVYCCERMEVCYVDCVL